MGVGTTLEEKEENFMLTRRQLLALGAAAGAGLYVTTKVGFGGRAYAQVPGGTLPPGVIPKFVTPLFIPPAMPRAGQDETTDSYSVAVRQFAQQILPPPRPRTTVWGYGSVTDPGTFTYPAHTIEATAADA